MSYVFTHYYKGNTTSNDVILQIRGGSGYFLDLCRLFAI